MPRTRELRTYRVRQLPRNLLQDAVASFLAAASPDLAPAANIQVFSLAPSLTTYETIPTKVATLGFNATPSCFDNDKDQWTLISEHPTWRRKLLFDIHFKGFTPLNDVSSEESESDCIAISGLASHAFGSWKERGDSNFMWLRDQVPVDIPHMRMIIYGYDTHLVNSQSFQTIDDLALSFYSKLRSITRENAEPKSLVFLAHSLGGVILKRAIALVANSGQGESNVLSNVRMIFFFGVPNQGIYMSHLLAMVGDRPNQQLVRDLSQNSDYLSALDIQFSGLAVFRRTRFVSVYETKRSQTTKEESPGEWHRSGPYEVLVSRISAVQRGTEPLDIIPIDEDHSNIVKFTEHDAAYEIIYARLRELFKAGMKTSVYSSSSPKGPRFNNSSDTASQDAKRLVDEMLASLRLEETTFRRDQIEPTYSQTFDWIFQEPRLKFQRWIEDESGIYWIRGKPGSGKSTFMKFLHADERTHKYLDNQTDGSWVASAWFFFYGRGSRIQKSFEGLLYSMLHQVISQRDQLAQLVLPMYLQMRQTQRKYWSLRDLKEAFDLIKRQITFPLRLYLFLDALDEYEGEIEMIMDFLKSITTDFPNSMTKFNVCFSSRPWNAFVEEFDRCLGFSIQEWTQEDIYTFTRGRMTEQKSMRELLASPLDTWKAGQLDLLSTIVTRASGVFLWVRLVVNELLRARKDGASLEELMKIVMETPTELEDYYNNIIQQLPVRYRLESYIIFEILVRSHRLLKLRELARAVDSALCDTLQSIITELKSGPNTTAPFSDMLRRLQSRCGGLVEVVHGKGNPWVQFMHQTVKELVGKPGFHNLIRGQHISPLRQNGHSFLFKAYATSLSSLTNMNPIHHNQVPVPPPRRTKDLSLFVPKNSQRRSFKQEFTFVSVDNDTEEPNCRLLDDMLLQARLSESTTGFSQKDFLDSIDDGTVQSWSKPGKSRRYDLPYLQNVMSFAVWADLRLYVKDRANQIRGDLQVPLLHVVVSRTIATDKFSEDVGVSLGPMCRLLLSLGADQDALIGGQTPFQTLIEVSCTHTTSRRRSFLPHVGNSRRVTDLVHALLENGQDPNMNLPRAHKSKPLHIRKAIHLSLPRVTQALLKHGANVNALTSKGHTVLDLSIRRTVKFADLNQFENAIEKAMLLLNHGAHLGKCGKRYLAQLILRRQNLEVRRSGYSAAVHDLCERLRTVQDLPGGQSPAYTLTDHSNEWPAEVNEFFNNCAEQERSPATIANCEAFEKGLAAINNAYDDSLSLRAPAACFGDGIKPTVSLKDDIRRQL